MRLGGDTKKFGTAVILAGGKSTRMGFDKKLMEIGGKRLSEQTASLLGSEFEEIVFISNPPGELPAPGCRVLGDELHGMGPLGGIHAGLRKASCEYVYFLACDMPNINLDYIRFMKAALADTIADACITKAGDRYEPFNAFYSTSIIEAVEHYLFAGGRSVTNFIKGLNCCFIEEKVAREFSPDWSMFLNLNEREELAKYASSLNT